MTIEVKNRSAESWGPLANVDQRTFDTILRGPNARDELKSLIKKQKKLKTYKVTFIKQLVSDQFEVLAESDYDVSSNARKFFNENKDTIEFNPKKVSAWEQRTGLATEYDQISYVKVRT